MLNDAQLPNQAIQLYGPEGYIVVIPEHFVNELKSLDDSFSDNHPLFTDILGDYLFFDITKASIMRKVVSSKLNVKLGDLIPEIVAELTYTSQEELPPTDEWTPVSINHKLLRFVSLISGRILVGTPSNHSERWIEASNSFSEDIYGAGIVLKNRSYLHRVFTVMFNTIPELQRIKQQKKVAHEMFIPIIKDRERSMKGDAALPNDAITWVMNIAATESVPPTYEQQAELQLLLAMASIHTSRTTITNALYDLLARPEYIKPLRNEVDMVWESSGGIDSTTPAKLVLLDSFLKESQRMTPVGQLTFDRRITARRGLTLSNGLHLRQGTHVAVAAHQLSLDPSIWDKADEFHGLRFSDLRTASSENANKFQFASTDPAHSLNFGYGNHDCPGRFFASTEIKLILAYLLRHYDMKAPSEWDGRPKTAMFAQRISPDGNANIMMRRRQT